METCYDLIKEICLCSIFDFIYLSKDLWYLFLNSILFFSWIDALFQLRQAEYDLYT